jgi:uncharacterized protein YegL
MEGEPILALNRGLKAFKDDLCQDPLASRRVEVAVVTFDSDVKVAQDFVTADLFEPPGLTAQGSTLMGSAIQKALDMIAVRKEQYKAAGILYYRPWVFMITDGEPQGESEEFLRQVAGQVHDEEEHKRVAFFAVGVDKADMSRLSQLSVRAPVRLQGLNFVQMFVWLSRSAQVVSHSKMNEQVALPPPGWGTV